MSAKYQLIVADPPWSFGDKLEMSDIKRGAKANYSTMTIEDIKKLPIKEIADPDGCLLALWVPSSILQDGLDVMKHWGFTQKQSYIWVKTKKQSLIDLTKIFSKLLKQFFKAGDGNCPYDALDYKDIKQVFQEALNQFSLTDMLQFNMGRIFRNCHEICLIGTNSNKIYQQLQNRSQRTVSFAPNLKHSAKPENLQDSLEWMFPDANKIELFARRQRNGWLCLGNEVGLNEDIVVSLQKLINQ